MTSKHVSIDGDGIVYNRAFASEDRRYALILDGKAEKVFPNKTSLDYFREDFTKENFTVEKIQHPHPLSMVHKNVDDMMNEIIRNCNCDNFTVYLTSTDKSNYRFDIYDNYKGNRKDSVKPYHYQNVRDYLKDKYNAIEVFGAEADDAISIDNYSNPENILVTEDKDLNMVPGWHYNFKTKKYFNVTPEEGTRFFYTQLLTGDSTDNIPGLFRVGPAGANKILNECTTEEEMFQACVEAYKKKGHDLDYLEMNARLLWMSKESYNDWRYPCVCG